LKLKNPKIPKLR